MQPSKSVVINHRDVGFVDIVWRQSRTRGADQLLFAVRYSYFYNISMSRPTDWNCMRTLNTAACDVMMVIIWSINCYNLQFAAWSSWDASKLEQHEWLSRRLVAVQLSTGLDCGCSVQLLPVPVWRRPWRVHGYCGQWRSAVHSLWRQRWSRW